MRSGRTALFADTMLEAAVTDEPAEDVPAEVEALDGIDSAEEAHNAERPARKSLKKKGPRGKPLSEFSVGDTVTAKVKTIASYGAFLDIGAQTDGLLHISQLSIDFVSDVNSVLQVGQDVEVRILSIDEGKSQVALSLLTAAQEQEAKDNVAASRSSRQPRERTQQQSNRRDDSAVLAQLTEKGWNPEQFVEGTVVSTVDFGAFVRIDARQLNSEVTGDLDGLVHISSLTPGRADSVASVVSVDDKVQVRVKGIANKKVSLSMISPEDEQQSSSRARSNYGDNAEWKETVEKIQDGLPQFQNRPLVVDLRK